MPARLKPVGRLKTSICLAPCDFTLISKFRKLIGEEGVEELLAKTITVAVEIGLIKPEEFKRVVVDSTVMPKAIATLPIPDF